MASFVYYFAQNEAITMSNNLRTSQLTYFWKEQSGYDDHFVRWFII